MEGRGDDGNSNDKGTPQFRTVYDGKHYCCIAAVLPPIGSIVGLSYAQIGSAMRMYQRISPI